MATDVTVLDDGTLQITHDGVVHLPLPVDAVQAAAARIADAQNAAARQQLTSAIRTLTDVLLTQGPGMTANVQVAGDSVTATVDAGSYTAMQTQLGLTPDDSGALVWGPATVTTPPADPATPAPDTPSPDGTATPAT